MADPDNAAQDKKETRNESRPTLREHSARFIDWTDKFFDVERQRFLVGLNSGIVAAIITTFYRNPRLALAARITLPPICAITSAKSWEVLLSRKLQSQELSCSACTSIRGLVIAVFSSTVLPATVGAIIVSRRYSGSMVRMEKFTESFSSNVFERPLMVAAILAQSSLGFIMASREFELNLRKRLEKLSLEFDKNKHEQMIDEFSSKDGH